MRWIAGHVVRYWYIVGTVLIGAIENAVLSTVVPVYTGRAFEEILTTPPDMRALVGFIWIIAISQIIRSFQQVGRNFGAELIGQHLERDIRDELYNCLLGKCLTFHSF